MIRALDSDRDTGQGSEKGHELIAERPSWRAKLLKDHEQGLTENHPYHTLQGALPGIKQVIAKLLP